MDPAHRVYPADRNMNEVLIDVYGDTLKASQAKGKKQRVGGKATADNGKRIMNRKMQRYKLHRYRYRRDAGSWKYENTHQVHGASLTFYEPHICLFNGGLKNHKTRDF